MSISEADMQELQQKYSYLVNYESEDPDEPIDPLTYVDSNGDTLLHVAAQLGDLRTVELLLRAGVDVNQVGDMGNTALHYAKSEEVASLLLAYGASPDVTNEFGRQPEARAKTYPGEMDSD